LGSILHNEIASGGAGWRVVIPGARVNIQLRHVRGLFVDTFRYDLLPQTFVGDATCDAQSPAVVDRLKDDLIIYGSVAFGTDHQPLAVERRFRAYGPAITRLLGLFTPVGLESNLSGARRGDGDSASAPLDGERLGRLQAPHD
jgi:hypothetical protein